MRRQWLAGLVLGGCGLVAGVEPLGAQEPSAEPEVAAPAQENQQAPAPLDEADVPVEKQPWWLVLNDSLPLGDDPANREGAIKAFERFTAGSGDVCRAELIKIGARISPEGAEGFADLVLARWLAAVGQQPVARQRLELAARNAGPLPSVAIELGRLALQERRVADAEAQFLKAERLVEAGTWSDAQKSHFANRVDDGWAQVFVAWGKLPEARERLTRIEARVPDDAGIQRRLGEIAYALGESEEAMRRFQRLNQLVPESSPAALIMAEFEFRAGKVEPAQAWIDEALKVSDDTRTLMDAAKLFCEAQELERAEKLLTELQRRDPENGEVLVFYGMTRFANRDLVMAEALFQRLRELQPANWGATNMLALALASQDDPAKRLRGRELAQLNLRTESQRLDVIAVTAWIEYRYGDKAVGKAMFARIIEELSRKEVPINRDVGYFLARYQADMGQMESARRLIAMALGAKGFMIHYADAVALRDQLGTE